MRFQCPTCDSVRLIGDAAPMPECCVETMVEMSTALNAAVLRLMGERVNRWADGIADSLVVSPSPAGRAAAIAWRNARKVVP